MKLIFIIWYSKQVSVCSAFICMKLTVQNNATQILILKHILHINIVDSIKQKTQRKRILEYKSR